MAPAKNITKKQTDFFIKKFTALGFHIYEGKNLYKIKGAFAGSDEERAEDVQKALNDPNIQAIVMARGGYGTTRIIDMLNFDAFAKSPKWIVGFSDISAMHGLVQNIGIESIHAAMPLNLNGTQERKAALDSLINALTGVEINLKFPSSTNNKSGNCSGKLIGGNLSVLVHSIGTKSFPDVQNSILIIEDIGESMYHIDRMMVQLARIGVFSKISGLIFGHFTDIQDHGEWFEGSLEKVLLSHVKNRGFPVCFGAPVGHEALNLAIKLGAETELHVGKKHCQIIQKN